MCDRLTIFTNIVRTVGLFYLSCMLIAASYIPREAMLSRDPLTHKISIGFCPTRGPAYFAATQELRKKTQHPHHHMSMADHGQKNHNQDKSSTPPSCPQDKGGSIAPLVFTPSLGISERISIAWRYVINPTTHFIGQSTIRQTNRGPPPPSVSL